MKTPIVAFLESMDSVSSSTNWRRTMQADNYYYFVSYAFCFQEINRHHEPLLVDFYFIEILKTTR